jgi:hypothetical protein
VLFQLTVMIFVIIGSNRMIAQYFLTNQLRDEIHHEMGEALVACESRFNDRERFLACFKARKIGSTTVAWGPTLVSTAIAFVVGYLVIAWLLRYLMTKSYLPFVIYRIAVGLIVLVLLGLGVLQSGI